MPRHIGKIGAEFAAEADRDFDECAGVALPWRAADAKRSWIRGFHFLVRAKARVEIDQNGRIRGMQV